MNRLKLSVLCKLYILVVILVTTTLSPRPYLFIGLALLLIALFATLRRTVSGADIVFTVIILFLTPLMMSAMMKSVTALPVVPIYIIAAVMVLPAVYLLDYQLQQTSGQRHEFRKEKPGRHLTPSFVSLTASGLAIIILSVILSSPAVLAAGIVFILYLLGILLMTLTSVPREPLSMERATKRIVAEMTGDLTLHIDKKTSAGLTVYLEPVDAWVKTDPRQFTLAGEKAGLNISFTPPLSGCSRPEMQVMSVDPRGLVQTSQVLDNLELHVIPRAKYAEWVARKYLEQAGTGAATLTSLPSRYDSLTRRGVEYTASRTYQPGDPLKNIDWKHTMKLNQVIIREFREADEQSAIIAVNLSVTDARAADALVYNLISAAMTMARENIPAALTAYTQEKVILSTGIMDPREILELTLSLIKEITIVEFSGRYLEPVNIGRIRRNIRLLRQARSEPAQRLLEILEFESHSLKASAKRHPASSALYEVTQQIAAPALIILVSQLNHDAEAVAVTANRLAARQFTTVPVDIS